MENWEINPFQHADINTYEKLVESFIAQVTEIRERAGGKPENLPEYDRAILTGIEKHLRAVAQSWINRFDPESIRRFYPEMRRVADARHLKLIEQQSAERICSECGGSPPTENDIPF